MEPSWGIFVWKPATNYDNQPMLQQLNLETKKQDIPLAEETHCFA
jgi:nicotinate-nucleotide--dimethylbenzimidazole phosphoribosyltransferase